MLFGRRHIISQGAVLAVIIHTLCRILRRVLTLVARAMHAVCMSCKCASAQGWVCRSCASVVRDGSTWFGSSHAVTQHHCKQAPRSITRSACVSAVAQHCGRASCSSHHAAPCSSSHCSISTLQMASPKRILEHTVHSRRLFSACSATDWQHKVQQFCYAICSTFPARHRQKRRL